MARPLTFAANIIHWYKESKRDLPWRNTRDPYTIWVSEIILQQTRVDQGIGYYHRFLKAFPDIFSLANADEKDVLNLWQGLGYYSRARNMLFTAKTIVRDYKGVFPSEYKNIRSLKGIGDYTAAAIASFSFKLPHAVVDGNVIRVITRLMAIDLPTESAFTRKLVAEKAGLLLDKKNADVYNQAIMELGALICVPANPACAICPVSEMCLSYQTGKTDRIPVRKKQMAKKDRYFNYAVFSTKKNIILRKRHQKDIWQNMYDFPLMESADRQEKFSPEVFPSFVPHLKKWSKSGKISDWKVQLLTHQRIHARFHEFSLERIPVDLPEGWELADKKNLKNYPLPKLIESYINGL